MATPERPTPPPRPKLGGRSKASAPALRGGKGFIPPTIHRQKVAVERAHETPVAPPTVEPVAPPTVSTPKVVGESPTTIAPATVVEAPGQNVPVAEPAPAPAPRVRPVRVSPPPRVVEEATPADSVLSQSIAPVEAEGQSESATAPVGGDVSDAMAAPAVAGSAQLDDPPQFDLEQNAVSNGFVAPPMAPSDDLDAALEPEAESKRVVPPPTVLPVEIVAATDVSRAPAALVPKAGASVAIDDRADSPPEAAHSRRRLIRYYAGGAIGLSFLLLAALMAGLWVHSFGAIDRALHATTAGQYYWLESSAGAIYFHSERDPAPFERQTEVWRMEFGDAYSKKDPPPQIPGAALQGVTVAHVPSSGTVGQVQYVVVSYWLVVIVLSLPGLWWLRSRRRSRGREYSDHLVG